MQGKRLLGWSAYIIINCGAPVLKRVALFCYSVNLGGYCNISIYIMSMHTAVSTLQKQKTLNDIANKNTKQKYNLKCELTHTQM